MPSFIWTRTLDDAFENPWEHLAQEQFLREAANLLAKFKEAISMHGHTFTPGEQSNKKAVWKLVNNILDSLSVCLSSLKTDQHRVSGKMYLDAVGSLDLALYFHSNTKNSNEYLERWYCGKVIPNSNCNNFTQERIKEDLSDRENRNQELGSGSADRVFNTLLLSYCQGQDEKIFCDKSMEGNFFMLQQTVSIYFVYLRQLFFFLSSQLSTLDLIEENVIAEIWASSMEKRPALRQPAASRTVFEQAV